MIAYRDVTREVATAPELRRLLALVDPRETEELLIGVGELEQGITDALHPAMDAWDPLQASLREAVCAAASAHLSAIARRPLARALERTRALLEQLRRATLPSMVTIKAPEGYLHYALDPLGYAASARSYASEVGRAIASRACIVGVRSIGTSLSAIVAAELGTARSVTVRPHGPPGRRRVVADASLRTRVVETGAGADVLIVDEGPGATGQTLACIAAWVESLGIEGARVVLLPHHGSGLALAPNDRRAWFVGARKHLASDTDDGPGEAAAALGLDLVEDLSAGKWRALVPRCSTLPSCPHHERPKHRARGPDGSLYMLRFCGRGRWGRDALERARQLAALGVGPSVHGSARGFLATRWIEGRPVRPAESRSAAFRGAACAYLEARAGRFATGAAVDDTSLLAMTLENTRELLGPDPRGLGAAVRRVERLGSRPAVIADARLQAHEWLSTAAGYVKTDALDHGDGIRPPGPVGAAWDLAGAAIEYDFDDGSVSALCSRCAPACDCSPEALARAVAAYRVPYAACCLGEMTLSAWEAASPIDRHRLRRAAASYGRKLRRELDRLHEQRG